MHVFLLICKCISQHKSARSPVDLDSFSLVSTVICVCVDPDIITLIQVA